MLLSASSAGLAAFLAGSIGGGGLFTAVLLTVIVVAGALWTMTASRVRSAVPSFKNMRVIDGAPSEIFLYLMNVKNYPMYVDRTAPCAVAPRTNGLTASMQLGRVG